MTDKAKFTPNLADAVSSILGQLDQLSAELDGLEGADAARNRVLSIKNQLAQIAPEAA